MRVETIIKFYGSAAKAARAIGCPPSNFCHWSAKAGGVISERAAIQFVLASGNKLDLGIDDYKLIQQACMLTGSPHPGIRRAHTHNLPAQTQRGPNKTNTTQTHGPFPLPHDLYHCPRCSSELRYGTDVRAFEYPSCERSEQGVA